MLLIDGVRYQEWEISNEDELEQMVIEHAQDIFGENSIYFDKKQKLKSLAGVGSIPDGLVIMFGSVPQWHIVEVELSSHDPYDHIVPQVDRFINGIDNQNTRNKLVDTLYNLINSDELLRGETRQAIGLDKDVHKFLADLISRPPTITIIIEKDTDQLEEALRKYAQKKVIEFQTFRRVGAESVHAHLFEPLDATTTAPPPKPSATRKPVDERVTETELVHALTKRDLKMERFRIPTEYKWFFPPPLVEFELIIGQDVVKTNARGSWALVIQRNLRNWFRKHPELEVGDRVIFTVIEPMNRYRLEIVNK